MNGLIIRTLSSTGVPVSFHDHSGTDPTYITFFEYNQMGSMFAEDVEVNTRHSIQVDLWSDDDLTSLIKEVRSLMIAAGFIRNSEAEFFEKETGYYHKSFRFYYENTGGI